MPPSCEQHKRESAEAVYEQHVRGEREADESKQDDASQDVCQEGS